MRLGRIIALSACRTAIVAIISSLFIRLLRLTWRVRLLGPEPDRSKPIVACFWHGHQAGMLAYPRDKEVVVLVSMSRDGGLQSRILSRLGFVVVRGSSSRGGAAGLKAVVSRMALGADAAFAVDGPRGPLHRAKSGAVLAAKASEGSLVPMSVRATASWVFGKAWDRYMLPKPFATVEILRGEPIPAAAIADIGATTAALEQALLTPIRISPLISQIAMDM